MFITYFLFKKNLSSTECDYNVYENPGEKRKLYIQVCISEYGIRDHTLLKGFCEQKRHVIIMHPMRLFFFFFKLSFDRSLCSKFNRLKEIPIKNISVLPVIKINVSICIKFKKKWVCLVFFRCSHQQMNKFSYSIETVKFQLRKNSGC